MGMRTWGRIATVLAAVAVAAGLFVAGRASVGTGGVRDHAYHQGYTAGAATGHADGLREGRAIQLTQSLPSDRQQAVRDAFTAGYTAGENDVFDGYDGGWGLSQPYVVVLVPGSGGATYRIDSRVELQPGRSYYLCPGSAGQLCQASR
ncbi:hypothetical protein [Rugosimonospora africana]|uniref:Uncharacterized protein n=1 Tax=Rugosimonospora africana TaxID=556532 RepID=A0A8J3QNL7_9ACTN|nr:hypothetical protein [Rugosimonospora africana]GIH14460.1 hypothetical protein Raf01_26320 [Rugosimonospora africana]